MTGIFGTPALGFLPGDITATLVDSAVRATVLLAGTTAVAFALRHRSAAVRHIVWVAAIAAMLLLPAALYVIPGWQVLPTWEASSVAKVRHGVIPSEHSHRVTRLTEPPPPLPSENANPFTESIAPAVADKVETPLSAHRTEAVTSPARESAVRPASEAIPWRFWSVTVWAAGALFLSMRLVASGIALQRLQHTCRLVRAGPLYELHESVRRQLRVSRPVQLLLSGTHSTPLAWGVLRPHILLPAASVQWSRQRLQAVLTHEMSHICRRDPLSQWLVQLTALLYWFHPLVWLATWRIRVERERACDDVVVNNGIRATDYAEHLLQITASLNHRLLAGAVSLAMARPHRLEGRLLAILRPHANRQSTSNGTFVICTSLVLCLALPLAVLKAQPRQGRATKSQSVLPPNGTVQSLVRLGYVDNTAEGRRSIAGSGHAIEFARPAHTRHLMAVEIYASRYGLPDAPAEDFHLYLLDENHRLLQAIPFPYEMIERDAARWYTLKVPAVKVPKRFVVALAFNPHQTKGIFLGLDTDVTSSHSFTGRPTQGYQKVPDRFDWMVRTVLVGKIPPENPFEEPPGKRE